MAGRLAIPLSHDAQVDELGRKMLQWLLALRTQDHTGCYVLEIHAKQGQLNKTKFYKKHDLEEFDMPAAFRGQ